MRSLLAVVMLSSTTGACDRRPTVTSCSEDLHGVWLAPSGRWAVLDYGKTLEAFTLFDDATRAAEVAGAPRVIDLARDPARADALTGEVTRRYSRGAEHCEARAPIRVTKCEADELQVVIAEPSAPLGFAPCTAPFAAPSRVERWRRE